MDYTVHGLLQARILVWVTFPSPGDLPNAGMKPRLPTLQVDSLPAEPHKKPWINLTYLPRVLILLDSGMEREKFHIKINIITLRSRIKNLKIFKMGPVDSKLLEDRSHICPVQCYVGSQVQLY